MPSNLGATLTIKTNDGTLVPLYPYTTQEKNHLLKINKLMLQNLDDKYVLYQNDIEDIKIAAILKNQNLDDVLTKYNELIIKNRKEIKIDSYKINPYIRVLGVSHRGKNLLSQISENKKYPVITSVKKFIDNNNNKVLKSMLEKDILASNIYTLGYEYDSKANLDYTKKLIIN